MRLFPKRGLWLANGAQKSQAILVVLAHEIQNPSALTGVQRVRQAELERES